MKDDYFESGDFERTLKEHADRFFLIPSERVWKSIYNDLHPGSKWPSLAAGLFMFLTLFWVGNTNREYPHKKTVLSGKNIQQANDNGGSASVVPFGKNFLNNRPSGLSRLPQANYDIKAIQSPAASNTLDNKNIRAKIVGLSNGTGQRDATPPGLSRTQRVAGVALTALNSSDRVMSIPFVNKTSGVDLNILQFKGVDISAIKGANISGSRNSNDFVSVMDNGLQEPAIRFRTKLRKKLKWEYFITPMISSVQFDGTNLNKSNSAVVYTPVSKHDMSIAKRIGFMVGFNTSYPLSRRFSLVTGTHLVYTGYNIFSEILQPNTTSLTFVDREGRMFSKNYISYYGNDRNRSDASIINYNWELALPVGLEWDALPLKKVKISVVSTLEPFMVLGSNAYLLSGDASRYVTDPDLVRKFNMSANLGGRISFSGNAVNWKIGPEFRYQILSTYNNIYPVKEHFMSYGIHVGVSKK